MRSGGITGCLASAFIVVSAWSPNRADAAPIDAGPDARTVLVTQLVDELRTHAAALPKDAIFREMFLEFAALYDSRVGRKTAAIKFFEQSWADAAALADPVERVERLSGDICFWVDLDPARARQLLAEIEQSLPLVPADNRLNVHLRIILPCFKLGEHEKAFRYNELPRETIESFYKFLNYGWMARECIRKGNTELLAEVRRRIRAVEPKPENVDPTSKVDVFLETDRIKALAEAGLTDEAAALYEYCRSGSTGEFDRPGGLYETVLAYVRDGKRDVAKSFLRKHAADILPKVRYLWAVPAAYAGDYDLVDELLVEASPKEFILELRPVILAAHRMGDVKRRDVLLARYRDALARWPKDQVIELDLEILRDTASVEAAIGRYDSALAKLPKLQGAEACHLRVLLIDLMLREQGKLAGFYPATAMYLDDQE